MLNMTTTTIIYTCWTRRPERHIPGGTTVISPDSLEGDFTAILLRRLYGGRTTTRRREVDATTGTVPGITDPTSVLSPKNRNSPRRSPVAKSTWSRRGGDDDKLFQHGKKVYTSQAVPEIFSHFFEFSGNWTQFSRLKILQRWGNLGLYLVLHFGSYLLILNKAKCSTNNFFDILMMIFNQSFIINPNTKKSEKMKD